MPAEVHTLTRIQCDPEAAKVVFSNPVLAGKTTLIPLDVSHLCLATKEVRNGLLYGYPEAETGLNSVNGISGGPPPAVRAMFHQVLVFFAQTYADVFALTEGPPLHDPLTVAAIIEPSIFDDKGGERYALDINCDGAHSMDIPSVGQLGRTVAVKLPAGQPGVRIPRGLDVNRFWHLTELSLREAVKSSPMPSLTDEQTRELPERLAVQL